jgi:hypothetical protein
MLASCEGPNKKMLTGDEDIRDVVRGGDAYEMYAYVGIVEMSAMSGQSQEVDVTEIYHNQRVDV